MSTPARCSVAERDSVLRASFIWCVLGISGLKNAGRSVPLYNVCFSRWLGVGKMIGYVRYNNEEANQVCLMRYRSESFL